VQALNYCAEAINDFRMVEMALKHSPYSALAYRGLMRMLKECDKYILPNCCNLIDPDLLGQLHHDLARLPAPCVAFESSWDKESDGINDLAGFEQVQCTRRIALCWEMRPEYELLPYLHEPFLKEFPEGGTFILPIYYSLDSCRWTPGLGGSFLPYNNQMRSIQETDNTPDATIIAASALFDTGLAKPTAQRFVCEPFVILPELFERWVMETGDKERVYAGIALDSRDEVMMFVQACSALHCDNVTTVSIDKKNTYKIIKSIHEKEYLHLRAGNISQLNGSYVWVFSGKY
jgi:hypothetical protein